MANETYNVKVTNMGRQEEAMELVRSTIEDVVSGTVAIVENSNFITTGLIKGACYVYPELIRRIKPRQEVFAQSILSGIGVQKDTNRSARFSSILHDSLLRNRTPKGIFPDVSETSYDICDTFTHNYTWTNLR